MSQNIKNALLRAVRTYLVVVVPLLLGLVTASGPNLDPHAWEVALWSGVPAALTFLWNAYYDASPIPSLKVPPQA